MLYASNEDINVAGVHWVENAFWRRVKAWTPIFLPNPWLKVEADLKIVFSIKSVAAAIGQTTEAEPIDDDHVHSVAVQFDIDMLTIIPKPIRDMLVHETWYTLTYARRLLGKVASLFTISKNYAKCLLFQAKFLA